MGRVKSTLDHVDSHCRAKGARMTEKRRQVLTSLLSSGKALSAYELIDQCMDRFEEKFSAMTMYRTLDFLQSENLVHKLNTANKYVACSHITCSHAHEVPQFLICSECKRVEEVGISKQLLEELTKNVERAGYILASPQLEMDCICSSCLPKAS